MTQVAGDGLSLAGVLMRVRSELDEATRAGAGADLRFEVSSVRVDLTVAVERTTEVKGGVKLWVVEAGAGQQVKEAHTHVLSFDLTPLSTATGRRPQVSDEAASLEE